MKERGQGVHSFGVGEKQVKGFIQAPQRRRHLILPVCHFYVALMQSEQSNRRREVVGKMNVGNTWGGWGSGSARLRVGPLDSTTLS